jgi:hypothetical protein
VILTSKGKAVPEFTGKVLKFCAQNAKNPKLFPFIWRLTKYCAQWNLMTARILLTASRDRDIVSTAAYDFLMFSGYVSLAYYWARMAAVAYEKLAKGDGTESRDFYTAKIQTAEFYFDRLLPRAKAHAQAALAPTRTTMQMNIEHFSFG